MERETQFIGQSAAFQDAVDRASQAALLDRPVLVIGERGTGKELIAERLHRLSARWDKPYVILNCAAMPETLIEAELFGHEAGAFTGATRSRAGRFEEADGGTLFLDELATMSMAAQERLLRAVEYGEITRVGASRPVRVDVRIVAATNEHLPALVEDNRFRADLLDRLSFEVITLPPLRAREGDIEVLATYFGQRMAAVLGWEEWPGFGPRALAAMEGHDWPGNVRELRNFVERASVLHGGETLGADDVARLLNPTAAPAPRPAVPSSFAAVQASADDAAFHAAHPKTPAPGRPIDLKREIETIELEQIHVALDLADGIISEAARLLTLKRTTLIEKMRKYGVHQQAA